jgi:hypothetical protein
VDTNATKAHLDEVARRVGISRPEELSKNDVVRQIEKANARASARARKK